ncbi:TrkA family potassium uptake protein [Arthrobacter zhaoxinii]|uniref:Trk system potassium uptake protein TrkA n=1 Tax=Arthrobacter zhaoxinii TaxID=2964616 RepID=A0ABY5YVT6_9MICC|nr:TrkA family potassium uptake protein [Arthrobacter zhaoxinii]UWX98326.1 TrkA family potassium uptake protein [Arthrobacter zhaoxinii]
MKVVIAGAGSVGSSIAKELLSHGHDVLLIDEKPECVGRSGLRGARWLIGDACELTTLKDALLEEADVVVSATGDDKVNLVVSLLAKSEFGVARTVGRVNNPKNDWMFDDSWGVDVAVNTPRLMTALVEEAVEIGDLVRLLSLQTGVSSMVEFTVPTDSHLTGRTLGSIDWPQDATVVAILRDDAPITPSNDDVVEPGDELFFITTIAAEDELRAVLSPAAAEAAAQARRESLDAEPAAAESSGTQSPGAGEDADPLAASGAMAEGRETTHASQSPSA